MTFWEISYIIAVTIIKLNGRCIMDMKAMRNLSYGLMVVTAKTDKQNGCITNTVEQVTSSPNRITLAVNKENYTHDMILSTGVFNVSIISEKCDFSIFERFGFKSGRNVDKFENFTDYQIADNGVAFITSGVNSVICAKVVNSVDLGSHTLFIADVTDCQVLTNDNSATYAYYHAHIKPKPQENKNKGKTVWRCSICGYEVEADDLPDDFECPLCHHPKSDFEKITG